MVSLGAFQFLKAKGAIKDVGRVLGIPFEVTNEITKQFGNETIQEVLDLGLLSKYEKRYPELFEYIDKIAGLPKSFGAHPCGKVISVEPTVYYNAIEFNSECGWILEGDMHDAEDLGLVKIDLLGLRTVDVIYDVLDMIGEDYSYVSPQNNKFDDEAVFKNFRDGNTCGIFQFESDGMKHTLKSIECSSLYDLTVANALFRPGSMAFIQNYAERKAGREKFEYLHKDLEPILKDSYGIIVFQEQLIQIGRLANLKNPDLLRKATAKKNPQLLDELKPELESGLKARGWSDDQIHTLWNMMIDFARYSFNKCVSGDTVIMKLGVTNSKFNPSIEEMYRIMNDKDYAIESGHLDLHKKYKRNGYGNALSMFDDLRIRKNKIVDIQQSGVRPLYRVTTESGETIECTDNHKFPTPNGNVMLRDLKEGDVLYVMGKYETTTKKYNFTNGSYTANYPNKGECGFRKNKDGESVKYKNRRQKMVELRAPCSECGKEYSESERFELHHIDRNRTNNCDQNLQWLCVSCHKKEDYKTGRTRVFEKGVPTKTSRIASIEYTRTAMTYDVTMADPAHTFISESGLVTCNSHALAYAMTAYICMYLKVHHPAEFITAWINSYRGDLEKIKICIAEAKQIGVNIKTPTWRCCTGRAELKDGVVYIGTQCIKQCNPGIATQLKEIANRFNPDSFTDLLVLISEYTTINKSQLEAMIQLNYFKEFGGNCQLMQIFDEFRNGKNKYTKTLSEKTKTKRIEFLKEFEKGTNFLELPINIQFSIENELIGSPISTYQIPNCTMFVSDVNTKWMPKRAVVSCYNITTGITGTFKVRGSVFSKNELKPGDLIRLKRTSWGREPAWKKDKNEKWYKDTSNMELWLYNWQFAKSAIENGKMVIKCLE